MDISVIIPCRNGERFLGPTLESVLNQTRPPREVIVVDDGSSDGSLALARRYGGMVRAIQASAGGAASARNRGLALAAGEAVMFLDADDLLGPTALEHLASVVETVPDAVACCPWYRLEPAGECWHSAPPSCAPRLPGQDDLSAWLIGWYHPPCSVLWSREAYERSGGWDPRVRVNQDGDIMMRGFVAGNRLWMASGGAAYYRRLPADQTSLSATRSTRKGVESRLFVLRRIARMLRAGRRIARYRVPLAEAFAGIAEDCSGRFPDLHEACLELARAVSGPPVMHRARRLPFRVARKVGYRGGRILPPRPPRVRPQSSGSSPSSRAAVPAPRTIDGPGFDSAGRDPMVSVVIPTFNRAHLLSRALDSVAKQRYGNLEVLVVDDGSDDGTDRLIAGHDDCRVRYVHQERNRGVAAARNRGMREARGSFIAFLDSDDEWLPDKLARQVALFGKLPSRVGAVYTGIAFVDRHGRHKVDIPSLRGNLHRHLLLSNVLVGGGSCVMIRRNILPTVGYFDETLPAIEDYDYWLRIARFYEIDCVAAPLALYHDCVTEELEQDAERRSRNFIANFQARSAFYRRNRHEMAAAEVEHLFLLESARRHLRWQDGSPDVARRALVRAVTNRPSAFALYPWLIYAMLPARAKPVARSVKAGLNAIAPRRPVEETR